MENKKNDLTRAEAIRRASISYRHDDAVPDSEWFEVDAILKKMYQEERNPETIAEATHCVDGTTMLNEVCVRG